MTEKQELKFLKTLDGLMENGPAFVLRSRFFGVVLWVSITAIFLAVFKFGPNIPFTASVLICFFTGMFYGGLAMLRMSAGQWRWLSTHISRGSVKRRIDELQA